MGINDVSLHDRKVEVLSIVSDILNISWYDSTISSFNRASLKWDELIEWDYFSAVHSEKHQEWEVDIRWYTIELLNGEKIFISYSNETKLAWYINLDLQDLMRKTPQIQRLIWRIHEIEQEYRKKKWIETNSWDSVHEIITNKK